MREYVLRRLVSMIPVLFLVSVISFALLYILPGDPALAILGDNGDTTRYQALRAELGLDQPLYMQYLNWLGRTLRGDLGKSVRTGEQVSDVLIRRVPVTLYFGIAGLLVGVLIAFPVAIISAVKPGSK